MTARLKPDLSRLDDMALAGLAAGRDPDAVRLITERNNQRLFRAAWSVLRNRAEAEDAVQSAYLRAFAAIGGYEGRSSLSTWLTRITINEALGRQRAARRQRARLDSGSVVQLDEYRDKLMRGSTTSLTPEASVARDQLRHLLEQAIARLPESFRLVFVLRDVEGLSVEETAETLSILPATSGGFGARNEVRFVRHLPVRRGRLRGNDRARARGVERCASGRNDGPRLNRVLSARACATNILYGRFSTLKTKAPERDAGGP
jgi:RNA polymerase sigma-70 factor (ECF subfamily)